MPSLANTASKNASELAVAVPNQKPELGYAVAEVYQKVACLLGRPGATGVGGDSQEVDAAVGLFDHE
jgi:hypothetical protein